MPSNLLVPVCFYSRGMANGFNYATSAAYGPPTQLALSTSTTGGTGLATSQAYFYKVTGTQNGAETTASSEQTITTGASTTNSNVVTWNALTGATGYRIYRGTATGVENVFYAVGNVTTFTDTGAASTAGTPPVVDGTADLGGTSQIVFRCAIPTTQIRLLFSNYQESSGGEIASPGTITVMASFQATAEVGTPVQVLFAGATSVVILPGQQVFSDIITLGTATIRDQIVAVRAYVQAAAGLGFPTGQYVANTVASVTNYSGTKGANNYRKSTNTPSLANGSNQLLTAGAATWSAIGLSTSTFGYNALDVLGYASDGVVRPYVGLVGDSIMSGDSDSSDQMGGACVRGMVQIGVPYIMVARGGETAATFAKANLSAQRLQRLRNCTIIFEQYGTNDLKGGATFATLQSTTLALWRLLAQYGAQIIAVTQIPRVTGTLTSTTGQVVQSFEAARQSYNAWIRAPISSGAGVSASFDANAIGVTVAYICDPASYVETDINNTFPGGPGAPNLNGLWYCGAANTTQNTAEGTHPNAGGAVLMIPAFAGASTAIAAAIPATGGGGGVPAGQAIGNAGATGGVRGNS